MCNTKSIRPNTGAKYKHATAAFYCTNADCADADAEAELPILKAKNAHLEKEKGEMKQKIYFFDISIQGDLVARDEVLSSN